MRVVGGEQVVSAAVDDLAGDFGLAAHGVDRDQGAGERQPLEQQRNGRDLIGPGRTGLLTRNEPLSARPGPPPDR